VTWFAGIDGGQTSTIAAIGDERGERARGVGPPADLVGAPRDSDRQARAIGAALRAACEQAKIPADTRFGALVAGVTGYDEGESLAPDLAAYAERTSVVHDATIAHAGALDGEPGIVVIAGTGSVALGNAAAGEPYVRAGGWGYFFGDEGGAIWIARTALRDAMTRADRGERSDLADRAFAFYGTTSLRAIQHAFAHGDVTRPALASFATDVLAAAAAGDADAATVRDRACTELARLAATVAARLAPAAVRAVSHAGGLWHDAAFAGGFRRALRAELPTARHVPPARDPAGGALVLARRLAAETG
jgi:N-acetylglucosamine kinase-like BadF-type ATPase